MYPWSSFKQSALRAQPLTKQRNGRQPPVDHPTQLICFWIFIFVICQQTNIICYMSTNKYYLLYVNRQIQIQKATQCTGAASKASTAQRFFWTNATSGIVSDQSRSFFYNQKLKVALKKITSSKSKIILTGAVFHYRAPSTKHFCAFFTQPVPRNATQQLTHMAVRIHCNIGEEKEKSQG